MKYADMPLAMWLVFVKSFRNNLITVLGIKPSEAKEITQKAKRKYKEIIAKIPEFEKKDRFKMNLVSCAMYTASRRTGHYPERLLADPIYRTRDNRKFCKLHGIRLSGPKLGRPSFTKQTIS